MSDAHRTVFLSYRRAVSWAMARLVRDDLTRHGFDVFMDVDDIDSGEFERRILGEIEARSHFLLLLEPRSLDRIAEDDDWLRREITHALAHGRNVVPLVANGARMPRAADLPDAVSRLARYNAVSVPHDYFREAMQKVRERFLRDAPARVGAGGSDGAAVERAVVAPPRPQPSAPTITATDLGGFVRLAWTEVAGATAYELQKSRLGRFIAPRQVHRGAETRFRMPHPGRAGELVRVRAVERLRFGTTDPGPWSEPVAVPAVRTQAAVPLSPRLTAMQLVGVTLSWSPVPDAVEYVVETVSGRTGFGQSNPFVSEIYRGTDLGHVHRPLPNFPGLQKDTYRVRAGFAGREAGPWSNEVTLEGYR